MKRNKFHILFLVFLLAVSIVVYFGTESLITEVHRRLNIATSHKSSHKFQPKASRHQEYQILERHVSPVNCKALIDGDRLENRKTMKLMTAEREGHFSSENSDITLAQDCDAFKTTRGYIMDPLTPEEEDFPIAFSILMYKEVEQVERLLRAIYRPQNYYCIHLDRKANHSVEIEIKTIVKCFDNVFIDSARLNVTWGEYSVLLADLFCMQALWPHTKWKYFINLSGQEFPLKTNRELVKILTAYNGANDIEAVPGEYPKRWDRAGGYPVGFHPVKGSVQIAASRKFVDYVLHNRTAQELLKWVKKTLISDETFFSTLNHNPWLHVPGSYIGVPYTHRFNKTFLTRFKNWNYKPWQCHGKYVREVCVFGLGDLPLLTSRPELFANKFYWDYQHFTLDCLEEWHYNNTRDGYLFDVPFNVTYYQEVDFVKKQVNW